MRFLMGPIKMILSRVSCLLCRCLAYKIIMMLTFQTHQLWRKMLHFQLSLKLQSIQKQHKANHYLLTLLQESVVSHTKMEFSYNNVLEINVGDRERRRHHSTEQKMNAPMDPREAQRATLEVMLKQVFAGRVFKF